MLRLLILLLVAIAPVVAIASDAESNSDAKFQRKVEKNDRLARQLAARLTKTSEQRKARDTRDVPYKGNRVSAFVRRVEKQKGQDARRAAEKKREEDLKKERSQDDDCFCEIIIDNTHEIRKVKRAPVPLIMQREKK